jgi:hypothetical protein
MARMSTWNKEYGASKSPPNKHLQRAGNHKVLARGRPSLSPWSAPRARVLTGQRAGADVGREAAFVNA